ncbi:hypothetical protein [Companilactobacillus musae]|uniref:hypothetical protein n=1 Tax=Companilactobacillus musae TaxID=1903258 RepID=UPI000E6463FC|nr:hypothetical protein [Companilactobacillus musae]
MSLDKKLNNVTHKIDNFNDETKLSLKLHVEREMSAHRKILPKGLFYSEIHEEIQTEVDRKMADFTKNTDLKPKELYTYLNSKLQDDPTLSKRQLHFLAYDHLAKTTNSKFLRRIFKTMKKRMK